MSWNCPPNNEAEAQRLFEVLKARTESDLLALARLLAGKSDGELLGRTELEVRDRLHAIGARALESALTGRKKGGAKAASPAAGASGAPVSSVTKPGRS